MREASVGHQCPECVAEGRRTVRRATTAFGGSPVGQQGYVTIALIIIDVGVALLGAAMAGGGALFGGLFSGASAIQAYGAVIGDSVTLTPLGEVLRGAHPEIGTVIAGIDDGAYYRLLTAMFIHYGIFHLLINMWALWVLGRTLEAALGPARFVALYLISGLGGNVAAYLISPHALSAGASTALFGLFAALFVVLKRLRRDTSSVIPILVLNLVITFLVPGISIAGHLGGLVTGGFVAAGLAYAPKEHRTAIQVAVCAGVTVALLGLTFAAAST
jgi:membrane associated rhomboid family serine protease